MTAPIAVGSRQSSATQIATYTKLSVMTITASTLPRIGITLCRCQFLTGGPNVGCVHSQTWNFSELRENAHNAPIRNTVVGSTGTKMPTIPIPISSQPMPISDQRIQAALSTAVAGISGVSGAWSLIGCIRWSILAARRKREKDKVRQYT